MVYVALCESRAGAALWFNRAVGPVDSLEWRVVESFLGDYRPDDLPCLPYLSEVPAGFRGAVCARLDADEAVASSRPLLELYRSHGLPLSLALLTGQTIDGDDIALLRELIASGGSVVSHSVRHAVNWGGGYDEACCEVRDSRAWIEQHLPEAAPVRYAVSPFHQNPPFAVAALANCDYHGFVGGIIANDPEFLLGRAGRARLRRGRSYRSARSACCMAIVIAATAIRLTRMERVLTIISPRGASLVISIIRFPLVINTAGATKRRDWRPTRS